MIDTLYNLLFRCRHRNTSFPLRAAPKPGVPPEDLYVVCLDCGKRFPYNWEQMRIGETAEKPAGHGKPKLRYLAAACTLPLLWLIGKAALRGKRSQPELENKSEPKH